MGFADLANQFGLGNLGQLGLAQQGTSNAFGNTNLWAASTYGTGTTVTVDGSFGCYPPMPMPTLEPPAPKLGANQQWLDRRVDEMRASL